MFSCTFITGQNGVGAAEGLQWTSAEVLNYSTETAEQSKRLADTAHRVGDSENLYVSSSGYFHKEAFGNQSSVAEMLGACSPREHRRGECFNTMN